MSAIARHHSEWLSLIEVSGPFLTLPVLVRVFPQGLPKVDAKKLGRARAAYEEWANAQDAKASDASALHATWVQLVLGELLEFDDQTLRSGDGLPFGLDVPLAEHHETLRPSMAIVEPSGRARSGTPRLLIAVWPSDQDLESAVSAARWAASPLERMTQLCRSTGVRLALVTNGERWTVVDAPVGQSAGYASWYAGLWLQEPITLAAFDALLGVRRFFAVANTDTIEALLDESVAFQQEVTDQLGYQVRRAVEVLVQALDRADLDRKRELLRDVPPARLYDAALTVMMRLVFLFCAEERGLLLLGDETYDTNYAVSTLRALLREEADRVGVEVLERRQDAWARLLATFRAVHGGVEHEALRLPALGGSLFDPDRFPFLEGRAAGTSWLVTPASPLPIDNRTVLHLLEALQLLRTRGDSGTSEARKLSYRALDIEQIGHVYEGLLDHVAVRVDADTLGLTGTKDKEPELSLDELNRERRHGTDGLVGFLKERTGRSTSALSNDLDAELEETAEQRLLVACGNDKVLVKHISSYHALIRKDVWGYPQIYRAGSFMVTGGSERRQTGTHYTPKSLTEQIVTETLEPLVYLGPAEGNPRDAWKLRSAAELLDLKICDMAMGSGAFLVQVCRWLAERVVEAWEETERRGAVIATEGEVLEKAAGRDLLPSDREERLSFARRVVAERCIYGVDINPMAVELAKLSLWLVTLAKGRPFGFLDHNLRRGDSLLGISRLEQLTELSMTPTVQAQGRLFGKNVRQAVEEALAIRLQLREMPIRDIRDVEAMATLDANAREKLRIFEELADAFVATVFAAGSDRVLESRLAGFAVEADRIAKGNGEKLKLLRCRAASDLSIDAPNGATRTPFHWPLEFPEVFQRADAGFDAVVGNPPFMGGRLLGRRLGMSYQEYLKLIRNDVVGAPDLCAYFFLRAFTLLRGHGYFGLLATKSISETGSRVVCLDQILAGGGVIYRAYSRFPWPGTAAVVVSIVWVARAWNGSSLLDDKTVASITGDLEENLDVKEPLKLKELKGQFSEGQKTMGRGFELTADERGELLAQSPKCDEVIVPLFHGQDLNTMPTLKPYRWVIYFRDWPESMARVYGPAFRRTEELVKPYRDSLTGQIHQDRFWKLWDLRPGLMRYFEANSHALAIAWVTKHLCVSRVPTNAVYNHEVKVLFFDGYRELAVLQSTLHEIWARWRCGTLGASTLRYSTTAVLETWPMPEMTDELEHVGERYVRLRDDIRRDESLGLTELYNRFHNPADDWERIEALRGLHREMDEAVLRAYKWTDIDLEIDFREVGYLPANDRVRQTVSDRARSVLLKRLVELNHRRYAEESASGVKSSAGRGRRKGAPTEQSSFALEEAAAPATTAKTKAATPAKKASTRRTGR
jgi:hypothetical protein